MIEAWDNNAWQRHQQLISGKDITFTRLLAPKVLDELQKVENHNKKRLFEIGCGTGVLTNLLSKFVKEIVAIDPSKSSVKIAREYNGLDTKLSFVCSTIEDFSNSGGIQFDIAVAHMVLHTIPNLEACFVALAPILSKKGTFLFTIPHPCFWALVKPHLGQDSYSYIEVSEHKMHFTISGESEPLQSQVPYFHRPLEVYSEILNVHGYSIRRLIEPFPDEELMRSYKRQWAYPGFLLFVCERTEEP